MVSSRTKFTSFAGAAKTYWSKKCNNFNRRSVGDEFSGPVADRREDVTAATDGANNSGARRIGLDFAANPHDAQINGAIEGLAVTCIGKFKQALARQHPFRIGGEHL